MRELGMREAVTHNSDPFQICHWCIANKYMWKSGVGEAGCNTPFILAFAKMDPFIYLIVQNVDLFIYCPLIFYTHLLLVVDRYRSQFIEYQENKQPLKIYEQKNICIYCTGIQKSGAFHIQIFCSKKGANHIPGSAEKRGPFGTHICTMPYIGNKKKCYYLQPVFFVFHKNDLEADFYPIRDQEGYPVKCIFLFSYKEHLLLVLTGIPLAKQ